MEHTHSLRSRGLTAVLVCAVAALAAAQTTITPPPNNYTPEQDVELGRKAAADARQQLPIMRDDAVASYIDDVGHRLNLDGPAASSGPALDRREEAHRHRSSCRHYQRIGGRCREREGDDERREHTTGIYGNGARYSSKSLASPWSRFV